MNHIYLIWFALVCGSLLTGASIVALLISERALEPVFLATTLLGFVAAAWGLGELTAAYEGLDAVGYALLFGAAAAGGGYALASTLLSRLALSSRAPQVRDLPLVPDDAAAVVVFSELEPSRYSVRATAAALEDLADEGLLAASIWVLPFLFMAQKTRYRAAGGTSPGNTELDAVAARLAVSLGRRGITRIETAACEGDRSLANRIVAAAEGGFRTIVVAQAYVAESLEVDRAKRVVDSLRLAEKGVTVSYSEPLWSSARCASLVAAKTLTVAGDLPSCGVILVGQAQPESRSRIAGDFDQQEIGFLNQVRMLLIDRGLPEEHIRIAWADWRAPEVTVSVRHLTAVGCRSVIVVPACFPLDSITTMLDLPLSVRQARADRDVKVTMLAAWHDDPGMVEALRARVVIALEQPATDGSSVAEPN